MDYISNEEINANCGLKYDEGYMIAFLEAIIDETIDDGRLSYVLVAEQNQFIFDFATHCYWRDTHNFLLFINNEIGADM